MGLYGLGKLKSKATKEDASKGLGVEEAKEMFDKSGECRVRLDIQLFLMITIG